MELELLLSQKQALSQRMQLSVKILQMNALDLEQYIRESALENPAIELEALTGDLGSGEAEDPDLVRLKKLEWLDSMDESNSYQYRAAADGDGSDMPLYEKNAGDSLTDVLIAQVSGFHLPAAAERCVRYLIGNLDENGYIAMARDQMLQELGADEAQLDDALRALHQMDPPGVGAADLRECLLIQARRDPDSSPLLFQLIESHLDTLAKNQLAKLAKTLGVSVDEVKEAREQLLAFNPKPGNGYSSYNAIPYIRPDLFVVHFEDRFQVILNDYNQPKIEISAYYRGVAKNAAPDVASYIGKKMDSAEWLISCIRQRKTTILRCAGSILRRQTRFFEQGPGNLVPMTLADVADDLEMHPSTISRAVRGKYLQCQWGVFGLADLFSRNVGEGAESAEQSQDMAAMRLREVIAAEDPRRPLSDQAIADQLQQQGVSIARRTVAKYREQMGIPPASGRKKF